MKIHHCFIVFLFLLPEVSNAQTVYSISLYDDGRISDLAFASLSDSYSYSDNPDSSAIPDIESIETENQNLFTLDPKYRANFLSKINVSENDNVFIYDYANDRLAIFAVKDIDLMAMLSPYADSQDQPYSQYDYMIGFGIPKSRLKHFSNSSESFVCIGKENPFVKGKMKPIKWKKTTAAKGLITINDPYDPEHAIEFVTGDNYLYSSETYLYSVLDLFSEHSQARQLKIIEKANGNLVCEKVYIESEGMSLSPLNGIDPENKNYTYQWTGNLFKDKPQVVFGFEFLSFSCQEITFISAVEEAIYINCDNRH